MRMIGSIPHDPDGADRAERFSDFLVAQNIGNMVEESSSGDGWLVWVERDDDIDRAKMELDTFLKNPADPKYDAADAAKKVREEQQQKAKRRRTQYIDYRTRWGQASQWAVPVTIVLMALSIAVSIGTKLGADLDPAGKWLMIASWQSGSEEEQYDAVLKKIADKDITQITARDLIPDPGLGQIAHGQVWRLVTPILLHFGFLHLLFNMFWLRDLGAQIEVRRGSGVMLLLTLLVAIISNLAEYWWSGPLFGGMSGVTYGLFGYLWIKQRYEPHLGLGVEQQTVWIMMAWLLICMIGFVGDVANAAHVVGLAVGAAFAYGPIAYRRAVRQSRM